MIVTTSSLIPDDSFSQKMGLILQHRIQSQVITATLIAWGTKFKSHRLDHKGELINAVCDAVHGS